MIRYMEEHYYTTVTRYSTGAFLRMKLGDALSNRDVAPHIFETEEDARTFLADAQPDAL
jgi:propionate CoA-transferase